MHQDLCLWTSADHLKEDLGREPVEAPEAGACSRTCGRHVLQQLAAGSVSQDCLNENLGRALVEALVAGASPRNWAGHQDLSFRISKNYFKEILAKNLWKHF